MSDEQQKPVGVRFTLTRSHPDDSSRHELTPAGDATCELDADGHCVTCSDEALTARVLRVDQETGIALVEIVAEKYTTEEIDITLVESVDPGDLLLVHGGVAIANL
jgi:HupF/HypC family protein